MDEVVVNDHALKHGLTREVVRDAWNHPVAWRLRVLPEGDRIVCVGCTQSGSLVQMVAVIHPAAVVIIHALSPPIERILQELGVKERHRWTKKR